jgi:uncharacterized integral membrane protein
VFYLALLFLIFLIGVALLMVVQNPGTLMSSIHLTLFSWHLPGIPVFLLCLLGAFLGGLLLYVVSSFSARRDAEEIKELRAQVEELKKAQKRSPSSSLSANFAPPVVPIPGFSPSGPLQPSGPLGSSGFSGPPGQGQALPSSLHKLSPSASASNLSLPSRQFPPSPQTGSGTRPPFPHQ